MTQTATFPNLETLPNVATQAFLYFSAPMGNLTEVDLVASGSFSTEFQAENLGHSSASITGTTSANLSINVPTGAIPVSIPSVTETFNASPFDGSVDYGGASGKDFAPVTSSSAAQTIVLTSSAALAAFTGNFRIPITVSGHATGSATSSNGDQSAGFSTQTSVTLTVIYHYTPNLPSLGPPTNTSPSPQPPSASGSGNITGTSGSPASSGMSPTNAAPAAPTGSVGVVSGVATTSQHSSIHDRNKKPRGAAISSHKTAHHPLGRAVRPTSVGRKRGHS
jgi:hypothetical protein